MKITRPMRGTALYDLSKVPYPVWATPKIDGFRCLVLHGTAYSSALKPIRNRYIRDLLSTLPGESYDGELIVPGVPFRTVASTLTSEYALQDFEYHVFDAPLVQAGYVGRVRGIKPPNGPVNMHRLEPVKLESQTELERYENMVLGMGYEGVMLRTEFSPYKCGRSTLREFYLVKIKRFLENEAEVVDVQELMHNENPPSQNYLGYTERRKVQENFTPGGVLGALVVRDDNGTTFKIGTGFTSADRRELWAIRDQLIGKKVTYRALRAGGGYRKPRSPVFKAIRTELHEPPCEYKPQ